MDTQEVTQETVGANLAILDPIKMLTDEEIQTLWDGITPMGRKFLMWRERFPSDSACCTALGIDRSNATAWYHDPNFVKLANALQVVPVQMAMVLLKEGVLKALIKEMDIMENGKSEKNQLEAAKAVQKHATDMAILSETKRQHNERFSLKAKQSYETD